jgi:hypothetical protein
MKLTDYEEVAAGNRRDGIGVVVDYAESTAIPCGARPHP